MSFKKNLQLNFFLLFMCHSQDNIILIYQGVVNTLFFFKVFIVSTRPYIAYFMVYFQQKTWFIDFYSLNTHILYSGCKKIL